MIRAPQSSTQLDTAIPFVSCQDAVWLCNSLRRYAASLLPMLCLVVALMIPCYRANAQASAWKAFHVDSSVWPGLLMLHSGHEYTPEVEFKVAEAALAGGKAMCVIVGNDSDALEAFINQHAEQVKRMDASEWIQRWVDESTQRLSPLLVQWIEVDTDMSKALLELPQSQRVKLISGLRATLASGGFVNIAGELEWLNIKDSDSEGLLPDALITQSEPKLEFDEAQTSPSQIQVYLPAGSSCVVNERKLGSLPNRESLPMVALAPTSTCREPLIGSLKRMGAIDWVQWRRALRERNQEAFPSDKPTDHALAHGSLVIGGGGGMPEEIWKRFVELAGGEQSRIVVLPTAVEDPDTADADFEVRVLRKAGAAHLITLPQTQRSEVESKEVLEELDRATGVWFGGGRQWRFVDAYAGTAAWAKIIDVCNRGGVIGGSSAGATIQGDLLVRGAPEGNQVMIADGYRRGLGLLPSVAIDQHFRQRNRFPELERCLASFPSVLGLGIDEQTALVVTKGNHCEVLGSGSVWCYPSYETNDSHKADSDTRASLRKEYPKGSVFQLNSLDPVKQ